MEPWMTYWRSTALSGDVLQLVRPRNLGWLIGAPQRLVVTTYSWSGPRTLDDLSGGSQGWVVTTWSWSGPQTLDDLSGGSQRWVVTTCSWSGPQTLDDLSGGSQRWVVTTSLHASSLVWPTLAGHRYGGRRSQLPRPCPLLRPIQARLASADGHKCMYLWPNTFWEYIS